MTRSNLFAIFTFDRLEQSQVYYVGGGDGLPLDIVAAAVCLLYV
jgi:hypothetical protein